MSTEQKENLDAILRQSAFPADSDVSEQRRLLRELTSAQPLPADVTVTAAALGGVPTAEVTVDGIEPRHVVLYFHGGVYVLGDAFADPRRSGRGTGQSRTAPVGASRQRRTRHRIASGIASQEVPPITEHSSYAGGLLGPMLITALALAAAGTAWSCPHDSAEAHTIAQRQSRYRGLNRRNLSFGDNSIFIPNERWSLPPVSIGTGAWHACAVGANHRN